jgi:hypothetical protein
MFKLNEFSDCSENIAPALSFLMDGKQTHARN